MISWVLVMTLLCATIGCAVGPAEPAETAFKASSPAAFAGAWRSVTPSLEFIGLSVASKSMRWVCWRRGSRSRALRGKVVGGLKAIRWSPA